MRTSREKSANHCLQTYFSLALPLLLSLVPVLSLAAFNIQEIRLSAIWRPLALAPGLGLIVLLLCKLVVRSWKKASLLAAISILLLLSYGHIYSMLKSVELGGEVIGRHRYLIPLSAILIGISLYAIIKLKPPSQEFLRVLTFSALLAVAFPLLQIILFILNSPKEAFVQDYRDNQVQSSQLEAKDLPDIYYIILDGYARADVLKEEFDYDNTGFLTELEGRGFYVAEESRSNYVGTGLSLASSLNMQYLQDFGDLLDQGYYPNNLRYVIQDPAIRQILEGQGYATVAFPTTYYPTEWEDADYYLDSEVGTLQSLLIAGRVNEFESLLMQGTLIQAFLDLQILRSTRLGEALAERLDSHRLHRGEVILSAFNQVSTVPLIEEPTFTFAHLITPHQPYIFDPQGEIVDLKLLEARTGNLRADDSFYLGQLRYISDKTIQVIDAILTESSQEPIIILQSDHGPDLDINWQNPDEYAQWSRSAILNAYLLPTQCQDQLYPAITPVNSFRVVLNCLFKLNYPKLEDHSYFSDIFSREDVYNFSPIILE